METTAPAPFVLDRRSGEALSRQLATHIKASIKLQRHAPGHRLQSVRDLAARHGLSTQTVADAYSQLIASGLVVARRGAGYFVADFRAAGSGDGPAQRSEQLDPRRLSSEVLTGDKAVVRLGAGVSPAWADHAELEGAWRKSLRGGLGRFADYGGTRGYEPLRLAVAEALKSNGIHVPAGHILLTSGATQAIDLVIRRFVQPGDTVLVEDPGYFQTQLALRTQGARIVGVPRTEQGPDTAALERLCEEFRPRLFFTQSALQNPTGSVLSLATAYEQLRIAEKWDLTIVEDDVSGDLAPEHSPRLAMLDQLKRVIYVGSFSKTLTPSLRVGYLATARADLAEALAQIKLVSTFVGCEPNEAFIHGFLQDGHYARHVRRLRQRLLERATSASARLGQLGFMADPRFPYRGGTFLWARHQAFPDAMVLADSAAQAGIFLAPGCAFRPNQEASAYFRFALPLCDGPAIDALARFLKAAT